MSKMDLLAFDIGASNGRGILGRFDGDRLHLTPIHHFDNHFSQQGRSPAGTPPTSSAR